MFGLQESGRFRKFRAEVCVFQTTPVGASGEPHTVDKFSGDVAPETTTEMTRMLASSPST